MTQKNSIDISVYVLTYYHEKYIRDALDSILSQRTAYRFEIVVSDDCSGDKTGEILAEYEKNYPDIIRVNRNTENIGIPGNIFKARCLCRGRYIVNLAGDDYWINDRKLQIQADFLENNPEYLAVCTRVELRKGSSVKADVVLPPLKETDREYTMADFENGRNCNTHGMMMRNLFLTEEGRNYFSASGQISNIVDDAIDNYLLIKRGRVYTLSDVTDAYRITDREEHAHSYNASYSAFEKIKQDIEIYNRMAEIYGNETDFKKRYINSVAKMEVFFMLSKDKNKWLSLYKTIPEKFRKPFYKSLIIQSVPRMNSLVINRLIPSSVKQMLAK